MIKTSRLPGIVFVYSFILGCLLLMQGNCNTGVKERTTGILKYGLIMQEKETPVPVINQVITDAMLKNEIVLYYKPISNTYVYVYVVQPGKAFRQIRPVAFTDFTRLDYKYKSELIFFKEEKLLEGTGCREIHLVISTKQLPEVEKILSELHTTKVQQGRLTELINKLNRELQNEKIKKILGDNPVELPVVVNHPFRTHEEIKDWLDKNMEISSFTDILEMIYFYECAAQQ